MVNSGAFTCSITAHRNNNEDMPVSPTMRIPNIRSLTSGLFLLLSLAACGSYPAVANNGARSISLIFDCTLTQTDEYALQITNNNSDTVNVESVTIGFYNSNGNLMGENTLSPTIIPVGESLNQQGQYFQFQLGGIPNSCKELEWNSQ
jgi:hypothetical protein